MNAQKGIKGSPNHPPITWVIFDFGNVLIYNPDQDMIAMIGEQFGVSLEEAMEVWLQIWPDFRKGKTTETEVWQEFAQRVSKEIPDAEALHFTLTAGFPTTVISEVKAVAEEMQTLGINTAIHTDTLLPHVEFFSHHHMYDGFKLITSCELGMTKETPATFTQVATLLGAQSRECLFIDDRLENVSAAQAAGMHAIQFNINNFSSPQEAAQGLRQEIMKIIGF